MKPFLYTLIFFSGILYSCSSGRSLSKTIEDDIYYIPGEKSLMVQEVEHLTGNETNLPQPQKNYTGEKITSKGSTKTPVINRRKGTVENISTADLLTQAKEQLSAEGPENEMIYYNTGYWIGGFKGSENDLQEVVRIIDMYPNGFGFLANGQDIALNLSFDPDWNVYTDNYRYWWFPSNTNIELYSALLFGTYPRYIWTQAWDNPRFDSWAFNSTFNPRVNIGFNFGWGNPGFGFGFGWGSGYYDPWGYNGWYGDPYYGGWYGGWHNNWWNDPWHHHHHYPNWGGNHWGNGNYPNWGPPSSRPSRPGVGQRPNYGGGVTGIRPGNNSRPNGTIRPNYRPNTSTTRPNTSVIRPSGISRPGSSLRPDGNLTRPNGNITRPNGSITRPNGNITRPNSGVTRPGSSSVTRPNQSVTRPSQVVRPNPTAPRPSRPGASSNSGNVKNYTRPQNNYRPTYNNNNNNNSRPSYNSGNVSRPSYSGSNSNSSRSSYSGSSGSSGSSYSPGNSGGGSSRPSSPAPSRPTRR